MKLSQLSLADYNQLDSIPVINQDLSASGFTPVANTYYRHTGATTDTFTQGVIYLYDTAYHKLGESGGTTLNKYTYSFSTDSKANRLRAINIANQAKRILDLNCKCDSGVIHLAITRVDNSDLFGISDNNYSNYFNMYLLTVQDDFNVKVNQTTFSNGAFSTTEAKTKFPVVITYLNETEITE